MTDKPNDAYVVSVLETLRDNPGAFSTYALKGIAQHVLTAWNTRATAPTTPASQEGHQDISVTATRVNLPAGSFIEIRVGHNRGDDDMHSDERVALRKLLTDTVRQLAPEVEAFNAKETSHEQST